MSEAEAAAALPQIPGLALERLAHQGGMSRVYFGRVGDGAGERPARAVAVKMLLPASASQLDRFLAEGELLASLKHGAVVAHVAHGGTTDEDAYVATEWLEGPTLQEQLLGGPLNLADAVAAVRRAAEGLAAAHRAGIVHRDVKPANLLLVGGVPRALKLLDFGIARRESAGLAVHPSFAGGTWAYMSPEQTMGTAELGARADVFALGCVLYEVVTARRAYPSDRSGAMTAKLWKDPPRLDEACRDVPPALAKVAARMLARDPMARPKDAAVVVSELAALGTLEPRVATLR